VQFRRRIETTYDRHFLQTVLCGFDTPFTKNVQGYSTTPWTGKENRSGLALLACFWLWNNSGFFMLAYAPGLMYI
jgi:hypothetical protein